MEQQKAPTAKQHGANACARLSFDQAKAHIQTYLKNLEENLLDPEDLTELYLLFVNCFQVQGSGGVLQNE